MKKIIVLTFLLLTGVLVSNAQIDNGRMESWATGTSGIYVYDSLVHWNTTELFSLQNSANTNHSAQMETAEVYEGASSIRLTSFSTTGAFPVSGLPGCVTNGNVSVVLFPPSISPVGGVGDIERHGALMGYYEYIPQGGDHGSIQTCLFKRNGASRDTVAYGAFDAGLVIGTYTHFVAPLIPVTSGIPDSSLIWIQSSPRSPIGTGVTGSILRVDSLYYSGQIGIDDISPLVKVMLTYPVPAVNEINVHVELVRPVAMSYEIRDLNGKIVATDKMKGSTEKINTAHLAGGNYFITIRDDAGSKLCADKFTIVR
jgi:hypothetical protein